MRAIISRLRSANGVGFFYLARLIPGLLNFFLVLFLSHALAPEQYAKFSVWFIACVGASYFFFGWLSQSIARHSNAKDDLLSRQPELFILAVALVVPVLVFSALVAAALPVTTFPVADLMLMAASVGLTGIHNVGSAALQAKLRFRSYLALEIARPLTTVSLASLFVILGSPTYRWASCGYVLGQAGAFPIVATLFRNKLTKAAKVLRGEPVLSASRLTSLRAMLKYGAPISMWLAISAAWPALERKVLALVSGNLHEVGVYSAEYDVAFRSFVFVLLPITLFAQPHIFRSYSHGDHARVRTLIRGAILAQLTLGIAYSAFFVTLVFWVLQPSGFFPNMRLCDVTLLCGAAVAWQVALVSHKWLECKKLIHLMVLILVLALTCLSLTISIFLFGSVGSASFALASLVAGVAYSLTCYAVGASASHTD